MSPRMPVNLKLEEFVAQTGRLPSLPSLYMELTAELRSPDVSVRRVSRIIAQDLAMTGKILQVVNSAYFGITRQVSDPERAVGLLGLEMVRSLVLGVEIFSMFQPRHLATQGLAGLWRHSMATCGLSRRVAQAEFRDQDRIDQTATAGFLHDMGKLLMATRQPERYREAGALAENRGVAVPEAERQVFGFDHGEAGGALLDRWELPFPIVEAVAFHHQPSRSGVAEKHPLGIVLVVNFLERRLSEVQDDPPAAPPDPEFLEACGLGDRVETWRQLLSEV